MSSVSSSGSSFMRVRANHATNVLRNQRRTGLTASLTARITRHRLTDTETTMLRRTSHMLEGAGKKVGKVVSTSCVTVSQDGKTLGHRGEADHAGR